MNILTIYDHPAPRLFSDTAAGLLSQGLFHKHHNTMSIDLAAMRFSSIFTFREYSGFIDEHFLLNFIKNLILNARRGFVEKFTVVHWICRHYYAYRGRLISQFNCYDSMG